LYELIFKLIIKELYSYWMRFKLATAWVKSRKNFGGNLTRCESVVKLHIQNIILHEIQLTNFNSSMEGKFTFGGAYLPKICLAAPNTIGK